MGLLGMGLLRVFFVGLLRIRLLRVGLLMVGLLRVGLIGIGPLRVGLIGNLSCHRQKNVGNSVTTDGGFDINYGDISLGEIHT